MSETEKQSIAQTKKIRLSRNDQIMNDIAKGLKRSEIVEKYNISDRTFQHLFETYLSTNFIYDVVANFLRTQDQVKPEVAYQGALKILSTYFKNQKPQTPTDNPNIDITNQIPSLLKERLDEIIKISEESCIDHPAHRQTTATNTP